MKRLLLICGVVALSAGCAKPRIRIEQSSNVDFGAWKRYTWQMRSVEERADVRIDQDRLEREMVAGVNRQFKAKGYEVVESVREAQFLVRFKAELDDRFAFAEQDPNRSIEEPVSGEPGPQPALRYSADDGWMAAADTPGMDERGYEYGSLVVEIVEPRSKQVLWRGGASGEVFPNVAPKKRSERLNRVLDRIFKELPESR